MWTFTPLPFFCFSGQFPGGITGAHRPLSPLTSFSSSQRAEEASLPLHQSSFLKTVHKTLLASTPAGACWRAHPSPENSTHVALRTLRAGKFFLCFYFGLSQFTQFFYRQYFPLSYISLKSGKLYIV